MSILDFDDRGAHHTNLIGLCNSKRGFVVVS